MVPEISITYAAIQIAYFNPLLSAKTAPYRRAVNFSSSFMSVGRDRPCLNLSPYMSEELATFYSKREKWIGDL